MTIFGWIMVGLWSLMGINSPTWVARLLCIFVVIGTLVWGTGSL